MSGRLCLSFSRRLHFPREYRRFFDQSEVFRFGECTVFRIKNDLNHFRLGITFKARGRSVDRNRVKRQVRECFRTHAPFLGSYDYNVVIPASKSIANPYPRRLAEAIRRNLAQQSRGDSGSA